MRTAGPSTQDLSQSCHRASAGSSELLEPWELSHVRTLGERVWVSSTRTSPGCRLQAWGRTEPQVQAVLLVQGHTREGCNSCGVGLAPTKGPRGDGENQQPEHESQRIPLLAHL